jgi:DNA ligase-1
MGSSCPSAEAPGDRAGCPAGANIGAVLLADLVDTSTRVGATAKRSEKSARLADLFRRVTDDELPVAVAILSAAPRQGRVGVGWATARLDGGASIPSWSILDLDRFLDELAGLGGPGVQRDRRRAMDDFAAKATPAEARFVTALLTGELRQGALAGVVEQAVALACDVPASALRRAAMLCGDLPEAARLARIGGRSALDAVGIRLGVPLQPMLAATAASVGEAVTELGEVSVEWKLDGIRLQAHRRADRVRLFTRNLNDVTEQFPAVVEQVRAAEIGEGVLDGEVIGVGADGQPALFQDSLGAAEHVAWWFDALMLDGESLIDLPLRDRLDRLEVVGSLRRIPGIRTPSADAAAEMLAESLSAGHEGVVLKSLESSYATGRRGKVWRKVKPVHTLDLVVIGVEWGSGRRQGFLSNLHLGALGEDGAPVMVGKTFKGLTDELLAWQTAELLAGEVGREGHVVWVRPELVVEIALDGVQRSTRYPGGVALRFARVRRYRTDKSPTEADRLERLQAMLPGRGRPRSGVGPDPSTGPAPVS